MSDERTGHALADPIEFWKQLRAHDWTCEMSDSHEVYRRGMQERARLEHIANTSAQFKEMYKERRNYEWLPYVTRSATRPPIAPYVTDTPVKLSAHGLKIHNPKYYKKPPAEWRGTVTKVNRSERFGILFVTVKWDHMKQQHRYDPSYLEPV